MMRNTLFIALCLLFSSGFAQQQTGKSTVCDAVVENGDTIAVISLDQAVVSSDVRWNKKYYSRYNYLQPKVVKVYPYAQAAGELMRQYDAELQQIEGEKERKDFIAQAEKELKEQFEGDLVKMTVSEGIILIKLIDRETGDTSYELIKELKGGFNAFMWQGLARFFGHNLKDEYDAEGDDFIIEQICERIERNELKVEKKEVQLGSEAQQ